MQFYNLKFKDDFLYYINQNKLPFQIEYIKTDSYKRIAESIKNLELRGAPLLGIAAGYGLCLAVKNSNESFYDAYETLISARPTAVNIANILIILKKEFEKYNSDNIFDRLKKIVKELHKEDILNCLLIGENGSKLFNSDVSLLHHCNTGYLATTGQGTALSVIYQLHKLNKLKKVFITETRPLLQGSRLTAFELHSKNISFEIIPDSAVAYLMYNKLIDAAITGADRIVKNGDSANKIGSYNIAIACNYHNIPYYIAAPETTIDYNTTNGHGIPVEIRSKSELQKIRNIEITSANYNFFNPSFDIIPFQLISGIITEKKVYFPPFCF